MSSVIPDNLYSEIEDLKKIKPISNDGKNILSPLLSLFESFLSHLDDKFEVFQNQEDFKREMITAVKSKDETISKLESTVTSQKNHIAQLEEKLEEQCQYTRRGKGLFGAANSARAIRLDRFGAGTVRRDRFGADTIRR